MREARQLRDLAEHVFPIVARRAPSIGPPLDRDFRVRTEVDEQPELAACELQVVVDLCEVLDEQLVHRALFPKRKLLPVSWKAHASQNERRCSFNLGS